MNVVSDLKRGEQMKLELSHHDCHDPTCWHCKASKRKARFSRGSHCYASCILPKPLSFSFNEINTLIHCIRPCQIYRQRPVPKTFCEKIEWKLSKSRGISTPFDAWLEFFGVHLKGITSIWDPPNPSWWSLERRLLRQRLDLVGDSQGVVGKGMKLEGWKLFRDKLLVIEKLLMKIVLGTRDKGHQLHMMLASVLGDQFWMETSQMVPPHSTLELWRLC